MLPPEGALQLTPIAIGRLLEQPPDAQLGDYAFPCFRFAKDLRKKPQEVAQSLAAALPLTGWTAKVEVVGAFLNLFIDKQRLVATVLPDILSGASFKRLAATKANNAQRVMIEFSQPNTHKEFHVGHGRNVALGNSLVRLFRYCGYPVVAANYFGDEGTHIATVLSYVERHHMQAPAAGRGEWLGQMYVAAKRELEAATPAQKLELTAEISRVHREIENPQDAKAAQTHKLWLETRKWSLDDFMDLYRWLDVEFDVLFYESEVSAEAQRIVDEFVLKNIFIVDQGAVGVDLKSYKLGFCILRKSDGNTLYATKDLALARRKFEQYKIDRNIYVVADEQNHHFKQVFKVLELMGFPKAHQCNHLSYGMVVLPEGKMSSRDGTAVSFISLRDMMLTHLRTILAKYEAEWSAEEIATVAHQLCDGAIKYGMVSTDPAKKIVFNLEDWLSFEGNSGPYLMYGYSRTRSILRKAVANGIPSYDAAGQKDFAKLALVLNHDAEHQLVRYLYDFNQVVALACEHYMPSLVATHLYYMCKAFNRFYVEAPILKAETPDLRSARLALTDAFSQTLKVGLSLLGMTPPDRM